MIGQTISLDGIVEKLGGSRFEVVTCMEATPNPPSSSTSVRAFQIAHVLFMDIVAYSQLPMDEQTRQIELLQQIVRNTEEFSQARKRRQLLRLPTGDGMALVFFGDAEAAPRCALEISRALQKQPDLKLRMGIHTGPVQRVEDINANRNVAGGGINLAQRVMDCGDAGHILMSKAVAEVLEQVSAWKAAVHDLGETEVKHGIRLHIYNLYTEEVGNRELPQKLLNAPPKLAPPQGPIGRLLALRITAATVVIAVAVGGYIFSARHESAKKKPSASSSIKPRRSIAVLGFKNLSGRTNEAWLSTALSEMLTAQLSVGERLRTVPGENLAQMKTSLGLQEEDGYGIDTLTRIQQAVDADDVLVGSYLALGGRGGKVHLDLKLQNVSAGETTAVIVEDGTEDQLPELVSRSGAALLQKLGVSELTPEQNAELSASVSANTEANRLYAEGLVKLRDFDPLAARDRFERAVKLDDSFALAHSLLSGAWSVLGYDQKSREEAKRAFDLSGNLPRENRLVIEGRYQTAVKDWPKTIEIYKILYTFFPDNLEYGLLLASAQRSGEKAQDALSTIDQLRRLRAPANGDPRIDLQEADAASDLGDARRSLASAQRAEQKAKSAGLRLVAADARLTIGNALYGLGQPKDAMTAYQEGLETYQRLGDRVKVAAVYYAMTQALAEIGDRTEARESAEKGVAICQQIGNIRGQALLMNEIGIILRHAGNLDGAVAEYEKSYGMMKQIGDKAGMIAAHGNISEILSDRGDLRGSNEKLEEITQLSIEIGSKRFRALNIVNLALNRFHLGETQQALDDLQQALDLSRQIGNTFASLSALDVLTAAYIETGDLVAGSKSAAEGLEISRQSSEGSFVSSFCAHQGTIASIKGDSIAAHQLYQEAFEGFRKTGDQNAASQISSLLAELALEQNSVSEAEEHARQAVAELDKEKVATAAVAHATLARVLLTQSKVKEAQAEIRLAQTLTSPVQDLSVLIPVQIGSALVQAKSDSLSTAILTLNKLIRDCDRYRFVHSGFDARLALGEIQMGIAPKSGVSTLRGLVHDASVLGFSSVMNKAEATMKKGPTAEMRLPDNSFGLESKP